MKKILILANLDVGLYNFRRELLEALLAVPYEVHIALPEGEFIPKLVRMGCIFHETKMERRGMNPLHEVKLMRRYRQIIEEVRPDAALTYTIKPNIYGGSALASAGIPYITNITGLGTAVEGDGLLQKVTIRMYRHAMRGVSCLFFQNQKNEQYFTKRGIAAGKHRLLPGSGVNLERFSYLPYPKEDEPVSMLFISRVLKEKGIDQYMEMAKVIHKEYPQTRFSILGFCEDDEEKPDSYRKRIAELEAQGILKFEGMQEDVRPFLAQSQCTVHPSFYPEGMSNVCLESAASGRPVITTDRAGCRDTVEDGKTGLLVKERDTEDLIRGVRQFLAMSYEQRRQMGLEARKKMEREFDRRFVVESYLKELKRILG
ncbi:MAG: glycosyltransferase family 4 protein [bacterium]|nr:glycosyltransferase family 4 protein [bacterium]